MRNSPGNSDSAANSSRSPASPSRAQDQSTRARSAGPVNRPCPIRRGRLRERGADAVKPELAGLGRRANSKASGSSSRRRQIPPSTGAVGSGHRERGARLADPGRPRAARPATASRTPMGSRTPWTGKRCERQHVFAGQPEPMPGWSGSTGSSGQRRATSSTSRAVSRRTPRSTIRIVVSARSRRDPARPGPPNQIRLWGQRLTPHQLILPGATADSSTTATGRSSRTTRSQIASATRRVFPTPTWGPRYVDDAAHRRTPRRGRRAHGGGRRMSWRCPASRAVPAPSRTERLGAPACEQAPVEVPDRHGSGHPTRARRPADAGAPGSGRARRRCARIVSKRSHQQPDGLLPAPGSSRPQVPPGAGPRRPDRRGPGRSAHAPRRRRAGAARAARTRPRRSGSSANSAYASSAPQRQRLRVQQPGCLLRPLLRQLGGTGARTSASPVPLGATFDPIPRPDPRRHRSLAPGYSEVAGIHNCNNARPGVLRELAHPRPPGEARPPLTARPA